MAARKARKRRLLLSSVLLATVFTFAVMFSFLESDACLDYGGSFEYLRFRCDVGLEPGYLPLLSRNTARDTLFLLLAGSLCGGISFGILAGIIFTGRKA